MGIDGDLTTDLATSWLAESSHASEVDELVDDDDDDEGDEAADEEIEDEDDDDFISSSLLLMVVVIVVLVSLVSRSSEMRVDDEGSCCCCCCCCCLCCLCCCDDNCFLEVEVAVGAAGVAAMVGSETKHHGVLMGSSSSEWLKGKLKPYVLALLLLRIRVQFAN